MIRRSSLLCAALALLLAACSSADERPQTLVPSSDQPVAAQPASGPASDQPLPPLLAEGVEVVAVPVERYTTMWRRPRADAAEFALDTRNPLGTLAPMLVEGARRWAGDAWYEVYLPLRPNGTTAWVQGADVTLREMDQRILVDLSERLLLHFVGDELVHRFHVGVGTSATPTGTGEFYVWVRVRYADPNQAYGIMALGLSGFSPVLSDWPGEGRMAIHGTPFAGDRGHAVSHGCVRVFNDDMEALVDVPLGTPVVIEA
ncbi:MAG: L,D-transpeptidase [Actinobacteria bacterium]|nr:L,D-transpeptidase [Actinomycetota bacterium]